MNTILDWLLVCGASLGLSYTISTKGDEQIVPISHYTLIKASEPRLSDLIETFAAHVPHIVATLAAKWYATGQVAAEPTANNTGAPLAARCFKPRPRLSLFSAVRTLYCLWGPFGIHSWHTLVFFQLLSAQKLRKLFLSSVLCRLGFA